MFRTFAGLAIGTVFVALAGRSAAEPSVLKSGDEVKGELTKENAARTAHTYTAQLADGGTRGFNNSFSITYATEYTIALKAGQDLRVGAKVVGKDRGVLLVLLDPTGRAVDGTELRRGAADVTFDEVSATGKYRVVVASDRVGDFTLQIKPFAERELEVRALEQRIAWLKRDIDDTEAKLRALKAKKGP